MRTLLLSFIPLFLFLGCAGEEQGIGSEPLHREPLRSASKDENRLFQEAVNLFYEADAIYSRALATSELKERGQLLSESVRKYDRVLISLAEVRGHVKEDADKRRIDTFVKAAQLGEQNACDSMPILSR